MPDAPPPPRIRLAPGTLWHCSGEAARLTGPDGGPVWEGPAAQVPGALLGLDRWTVLAALFAEAVAEGGPAAALRLQELLRHCAAAGVLDEGVGEGAAPGLVCRIVPGSGLGPVPPATARAPFALVAHCLLRPGAEGWRLSSPVAVGEATVTDPALLAALVAAPSGWTPCGGAQTAAAALLVRAGLLVGQDFAPPRSGLATHELWLHALSRRGSAARAVGATGRDRAHEAAPAGRGGAGAEETQQDRGLALPVPPGALTQPGPGMLALLRARRSWRETPPQDDPTAAEIGALLWHAARDRAPPRTDADGFERLARPVPGAGGCHASDLYLALRRPPAGLPAFGRYDAAAHALVPIAADPSPLLREAGAAMGRRGAAGPAGLIVLGARFDRVAWKYGDAGYALMLKDAGVLLQTLHLVATALGRGSCILGGGNSRAFAGLTGCDPLQEGPVGEIALTGRLPPEAQREDGSDDG